MRNANKGRGFLRRVSGFAKDASTAWANIEAQQSGRTRAVGRRCPYCAEWIDLASCNVVSSARGIGRTPGSSSFDNLGPAGAPGGEDSTGAVRLLYDPHSQQQRRPGSGALLDEVQASLATGWSPPGRLVPLNQIAPAKLMPRRLCYLCRHQLPVELDERPAKFLTVVGVTSVGKTVYLTQSLSEATRTESLRRFGCTRFELTDVDATADVLYTSYFGRLFHLKELHGPTNPKEPPKQFTFSAEVDGDRFLVVTHDIAGESVSDPYARAQELVFLPHSDAIVFLLDPVDFDAVRVRLPAHVIGPGKPADQVHVLRQCLAELDEAGRSEVPVRVVVAKADLLSTYCGIDGPWRRPPAGDWRREINEVDEAVRTMLASIGQTAVLRLVERRHRVLFHAVSSLGAAPDEDGHLRQGEPFRCSDPLGSALYSMTHVPAAAG